MDFKSYKNSETAKIIDKVGVFDNVTQDKQEEMSQFISNYGGKSQEEIFKDFLLMYKTEGEKGNMTKEKLRQSVMSMSGMLSQEQLAKINEVIDGLE